MILRIMITYLMICSLLLVGCAGRQAYPISSHQPGDKDKACDVLRDEINYLRVEHEDKKDLHQTKEVADIALFIGGLLILVPWFFMDFKDAEKVEYQAIDLRIKHLSSLAREKRCGFIVTSD